MSIFETPEYTLIKAHYGRDKAKRSQVLLINHIDEGVGILERMGASDLTCRAFCLHPFLQSDADLKRNWVWVSLYAKTGAVLLAMEYRRAANAYLCRPDTDHYTLADIARVVGAEPMHEVVQMLWADKHQNRKDFDTYHKGSHPRSVQLENYFERWIEYLSLHV